MGQIPRRQFMKGAAATTALGITITTDAKLNSQENADLRPGPAPPGFPYIYTDDEE